MRKYQIVMSAVAMAGCMTAHAAETIYVGGFGGSTEQIFKEKIIPPFEAKTGAKVIYVSGNSTDTLAKLQAQKGRQEMSLVMIDDGPMYQAIGQGLCAKVEDSGSIKELYPNARMVGDRSVGIGFIATGLAYNKEVFAKNGWAPPTSWLDLADPKFKQKVVIPPITNGYGLLTLVMMSKLHGGDENKMDPGFDVMTKKVAPNVLAWEPSPGKMAQMLQTGEAALAVWGNGRVQAVIDQGAPVEFVYPKEGAVALMSAACVVEGAPQAKLGQQFMQHVVSADSQAVLSASQGWGPVNTNAKLSPDVMKKVVYGPDKVKALVSPNYEVINTKRAEWTSRWNRAVER
ncbi:putative spermidine/putrescine transport system substrate-binding protein [Variovorax sp. YR750]|uniref:ABC transporter substrate-binding protein n=1 Tax=Variovorax sp. YR750 TaxID=1884384 RepID=UPI0008BB2E04|nr:ABC transporter substrate-binding protein [Variovorax sp. YR750]SEM03837.1 putative spermidine/putrescine transport system substrate-binding protein [Variovorax sp. YR750]